MKLPTLSGKKPRPESLEAHAFFQGAHGVDLKPGLERVQANFDQEAAKYSHDAVAREKKHETVLERVRAVLPDAEAKADQVNERIGIGKPQAILPALAVASAFFMAAAESAMLAPALDVLHITNPFVQVFAATAIVLVSCWAFHFAWESFTSDQSPRIWRNISRIVAILVAVALTLWGIFRGSQVAFAANLDHNPLGQFLSGHPVLASAFYIFVTLATPIVVAAAMQYGVHHLRDWWEWKTANAKVERLRETRVTAQKQLETEREQHQQVLKQLAYECAQWKASYRIHHERGARHKAVKQPLAIVFLKAALAAILAGLLLFWAPLPCMVGAVLAAGIAAYLYFQRKREHPGAEDYLKSHKVVFAPNAHESIPSGQAPLVLEASVTTRKKRKGLLP
jgi:hypothetical protein